MRYYASLLLLAGLFLGVAGGCSETKKTVQTPTDTAPPPPVQKDKKMPSKAEK